MAIKWPRWLFKEKPLSQMDIYEVAASHRAKFLAGEATAVGRIRSSYMDVEKKLKSNIGEVEAKIAAYYAAGGEPGEVAKSWLLTQERFQALLAQVEVQIERFAATAKDIATEQQKTGLKAGAGDAGSLIGAQIEATGISATFHGLHARAFEEMAGILANGSPLYGLFKELAPNAVAGARAVLSQSMVEGWNPRKSGSALAGELNIPQNRAVLIARTESIRAYRLANQRTMVQNSDLLQGWIWYASQTDHTCPVCLAMDGSEHPVEEIMNSHPACRCTMVPLVKSLAGVLSEGDAQDGGEEGSLDTAALPERDTGPEWFDKQSPEFQRETLGPSKYDLYADGKIDLQDLVEPTYDDRWGKGLRERSLKSLMQIVDAGTTHKLLGAQMAAEAAAKKAELAKLAKIVATQKAEAAKLAAAKQAKDLAEKQLADAKALADEQAKLHLEAVVKDQAGADFWVQNYINNLKKHDNYQEPTVALNYIKKAYPLATMTGADIALKLKSAGLYSATDKAVWKARQDVKHAALVAEHDKLASAKLPLMADSLVSLDIYMPPDVMLNHLTTDYPEHTITLADVQAVYDAKGILSPLEKQLKEAALIQTATQEALDAIHVAVKNDMAAGKYYSPADLHAFLPMLYPKSIATLAEVEAIYKTYGHVPPTAKKLLGYPDENLLIDAAHFKSKDAYVEHLVKEVGPQWTAAQLIEKIKLEYPGQNAGWNVKGLEKLATKLKVTLSWSPTAKSGPVIVPSKPIPSGVLEPWKLNPEAVVLGGTKTAGPGGSNPGGFYTGTDGAKYYVKEYADAAQAYNEQLANSIYRELGITAAETTVFTDSTGKTVYVSKIIENEGQLGPHFSKETAERILDGFAADVLLSNWDVIGMANDNVVTLNGGGVARIDNGGSLLYRAKAGRKPIGKLDVIDEWDFFASANSTYRGVFDKSGISSADELGAKVVAQIKEIEILSKSVGGWRKFVDETVPQMGQADRDLIVKTLDRRMSLLASKRTEVENFVNQPKVVYGGAKSSMKTKMFGKADMDALNKWASGKLGATVTNAVPADPKSLWFGLWPNKEDAFKRLLSHIYVWTGASSGHIFHQAITGKGSGAMDMKLAVSTRQQRWDQLATLVGLAKAPSAFKLFRGMKGDDVVHWVAYAWQDESAPYMRALQEQTASWTLDVSVAKKFASGRPMSVVWQGEVPMMNTFFDKWVDDGSFMKNYWIENEVIAGGNQINPIAVNKSDVKVRLNGIEYTYDRRADFLKAYEAHYGGPPTELSLRNAGVRGDVADTNLKTKAHAGLFRL